MAKRREPTWVPKPDDYQQLFSEQNPWHSTGTVPDELAYEIERPLADSLWHRLKGGGPRRYQLVLGPRRVGKTTCLYQTVRRLLREHTRPRQLWWLRLDHPLLMQVPLNVIVEFVLEASKATAEEPALLFLDELTYARDWDLWLKTFYDERRPIQLAASSSSTAALKNRRVESGVGRWEEQYLAPYLFGEFLSLARREITVPIETSLADTLQACIVDKPDTTGIQSLRQVYALTGGFPELLVGCADFEMELGSTLLRSQRTLKDDAVDRAIYKDIPQAFGVDNPMLLERMLYTLAGQVTGILSPADLCQTLNFSPPTFDRYLSFLIRAFLVFTVPNYSGSEATKQRRGKKLYFVDGAVRNAALQRGIAPLNNPTEMGLMLENLVAAHLHALSQQTQVRLYYWREKTTEVDLIYDEPDRPLAFEIASSPGHEKSGLHSLIDRFPRFKGGCYLVAPDAHATRPEDAWDEIGTLPLDLVLLALSGQADRELQGRLAVGVSR